MNRKVFSSATVILLTAAILVQPVMAASTASAKSTDDMAYLKEYFGVALPDQVDAISYNEALKSIYGEEAPQVDGDLSWKNAIESAVLAADYEELAESYPDSKVANRLIGYGLVVPDDDQFAQDLVTALDVKLISLQNAAAAQKNDNLTRDDAAEILMDIVDANGDGRNYLGNASDSDIYRKIDQEWRSFIIFDDGTLSEIGKELVEQQITTGYGIKAAAYDANFLSDLTLQYGHSDIKHAHQLIGLLNSENIDAKIALEPKISIYQYLLDWGPVPESTPTYAVKKLGDNLYLTYAVEYDLKLEFNNVDDMLRFDSIIKTYAKRESENAQAIGKISGAWWQPLYSGTVADILPDKDYHEITDCVVSNGMYSIHPFATVENTEATVKAEQEIAVSLGEGYDVSNIKFETVPRYCNTAFFNYLTGTDYE